MVDLLAVCAHPDDLEVCAGGIFIKAKREGKKTGLVLLTRGEAGGYADRETREREAEKGAELLGLDYFEMLDFPDAGLFFSPQSVEALVPHLRACSPRLILTLHPEDYHPDHAAASQITRAAAFRAGLKCSSEDGSDWHYDAVLFFGADTSVNRRRPDLLVDISDVIGEKRAACEAHASQKVTEFALALARENGRSARVEYAEGLYLWQSLTVSRVSGLFL